MVYENQTKYSKNKKFVFPNSFSVWQPRHEAFLYRFTLDKRHALQGLTFPKPEFSIGLSVIVGFYASQLSRICDNMLLLYCAKNKDHY